MVNDSALVETPLQANTARLNLKPDSHWYNPLKTELWRIEVGPDWQ